LDGLSAPPQKDASTLIGVVCLTGDCVKGVSLGATKIVPGRAIREDKSSKGYKRYYDTS